MKIDIHTHIIPEQMPDWAKKFGYGGFIHLDHHKAGCARMMVDDKFFREVQNNVWDAEVRIHECDHHHVDMQVLSTIPVMFNYWAKPKDCLDVSKFLNDHIAKITHQFPEKFYGLGNVPLQDVDLACSELERCIRELKLNGVQIGSNVNRENLNEKKFFSFWELAEKLNACIFVHPWEMMGKDEMQKYWLPWLVGMPAETSRAICSMLFGGVFEKFKNLRIAFAHGGGSFPSTIGRIAHGFEERPDLVAIDNSINPRDYVGKFYLDTLVHDKLALEYLITLWGNEKLCMGSDYPFPLGEQQPGKLIESMNLNQETKENLLSKNALQWLFGNNI
jgi:aminocarboxymuconate-semialdehyde decarboxylase